MVDEIKTQDMDGQTVFPEFEPEPPEAEVIKKHLPVVQFKMDFLRSPEDAILQWGKAGSYETWFKRYYEALVKAVAEATGADPEQIADKEKRTPEQQRLLTEAAAGKQMERIDAFFESRYMDAINTLEPLQGIYKDPGEIDFYTDSDRFNPGSEYISIKEQAVLYFFALHDDLSPTESAVLTPDQEAELREIFSKLDAFYMERTGGGNYDPEGATILFAFIERENPGPQTAETILAKLPMLQGITPKAHTMPNNALMNVLQQKDAINAGAFDMVVSNARGRRKEITAFTMVTYDPGETSIKITDTKLSEYERQVSDAIVSLWLEATKENLPAVFTPDMIYRAMPGGGDKASAQQKGAITKAIEKFRRLHITVDATEELRKRGVIPPSGTFKLDRFYLTATHAEYRAKNGGQVVNAYQIDQEPIILTYCNLTKQLLTIPAEYLTIKKIKKGVASGELVSMNSDRQAMTGYILRRIAIMKRDRKNKVQNQSTTILFDTIFSDVGIADQNRDRAMDNRNFCFQVLDYQIAAGNIKGYEKQTQGRSITGVNILF